MSSFDLHSRVVRIGGPTLSPNCGYRDILIHEMTEGEIRWLRGRAVWALLFGLAFGFIGGASLVFYQWAQSVTP